MKKRLLSMQSLFLTLLILAAMVPQKAYAAGISFTGAGSLRAGDSVSVTFNVSGDNILAVECNLDYDSTHLELIDISQQIGGSWVMDRNGSLLLFRDAALNSPINSSTALFSAKFRVTSDTSSGTTVSASVNNVSVSDGNADTFLGNDSWSANILPPLSGNNVLRSLSCSNGTLSPSFSSGVLEYRMTVPYEVSSLNLDWNRDHSGSSVSVSGNSLSVGANTVSITVTAENGSPRTYYIYVTREQDPNYVPSSDATLSELVPSAGTLSPAFDPATRKYVVYLPYETETIEINGTAADEKAKSISQAKSESLKVGENLLLVICTAEDGTTTAAYQVKVVRMPVYAGILPQIIAPDSEALKPEKPKEPTTMEIPLEVKIPYVGKVPTWALAAAALVLLLVIIFVPIWFWGRHSGKARVLKQLNMPPDSQNEDVEDTPTDPEEEKLSVDGDSELPAEDGDLPPEDSEENAVPAEKGDSSADETPVGDTDTPSEEEPLPEEEPSDEEPSPEAETSPRDESAAEEETSPDEASSISETPAEKKDSAEDEISLTQLLDDIHNM